MSRNLLRKTKRENVETLLYQTLNSARDVGDAIPYKLPTILYGDVCRGKRPRLPEEKTILPPIKAPLCKRGFIKQQKRRGFPLLFLKIFAFERVYWVFFFNSAH